MMKRVAVYSLIVLMSFLAQRVSAAGSTGADYLLIDVPAAIAAMGAGTAASGGSGHVAWNPAGILGQKELSCSLTHVASFVDTAYEQLEGLYPQWLGGAWAGRLFFARTYNFIQINELGLEVGDVDNHDLLLQLSHARELGWGLRAGLSIKAFESALAGYTSQGAAVDAGVQYDLPNLPVALGLALQNFGTMSAFEQEADPLPLLLRAGVGFGLVPFEKHQIQLNLDVQQPLVGSDELTTVIGMVYSVEGYFTLRGGYRVFNELGTLSFGAGVRYEALGLDYAYQPFDGLGDNHRFTLTYYFEPEEAPAAAPRDLDAQHPDLTTATPAMQLKATNQADPKVKTLTILPRHYEGKLLFKTPEFTATPKEWVFEIKDAEGRVVKKYTGKGLPPKTVSWDGRDESGALVPQAGKYQFVFAADKQTVMERRMPQLEPVLKLQFVDKSDLEAAVRFVLTSTPEVFQWRLDILSQKDRQTIRTIQGMGALPEEILWDGKNEAGIVADTNAFYEYGLTVTFADKSEASVYEKIQAIQAKEVVAGPGQRGILIRGILFDFNSAVLVPTMTDKCLAAAEIVRRHPGMAKAICEGHADEVGTQDANLKLSQERAHMVANFLGVRPYVSRESISFIGFGKSQPENKLKTETGRARNRRVEIRLKVPAPQ